MTSLLRGVAAMADAPVFAIAASGARWAVQDLRLADGIALVDSPRAASVLLVAGSLDASQAEAAWRIHDALPHPRATVIWSSGAARPGFPEAVVIPQDADPAPTIRSLYRDLVLGERPSEAALLPDIDPAPWRGVGPYGQGGTGMTGGAPFGRPMAELGPDRDGLRLDVLPIRLGPFFPPIPTGLELDVRVAGDVIIDVAVAQPDVAHEVATSGSPFLEALGTPQRIAVLEMERARSHLRWVSDALRLQGLGALALRALDLAGTVGPGEVGKVSSLSAAIGRTGIYRWSLPPIDATRAAMLAGAGLGPASRGLGASSDERLEDPVYRALGFEPVRRTGAGGGIADIWRTRLDEVIQSLELAARSGGMATTVSGAVEAPRGRLSRGEAPSSRALALVPVLLEGLEWGDAMATMAALDIDIDESRPASTPLPA